MNSSRLSSSMYIRMTFLFSSMTLSTMVTSYLPPGIVYLSHIAFYVVVLPCSVLWVLRHFLTESGFSVPVWPVFVVPFASQVIFRLVHAWYIGFAIRREAAAQGAILMPCVQESSISIMRRIVDSFKNGYPSTFDLTPCCFN